MILFAAYIVAVAVILAFIKGASMRTPQDQQALDDEQAQYLRWYA